MIHRWGSSGSSSDKTQVDIKVNWNGFCSEYTDIFFVTAIEDSTGHVLWSNYILLVEQGHSITGLDAQVEIRKQEFCLAAQTSLAAGIEFFFATGVD